MITPRLILDNNSKLLFMNFLNGELIFRIRGRYGLFQGGIAMAQPLPDKHLSWNLSGKSKLFDIYEICPHQKTHNVIVIINVNRVNKKFNMWSFTELTYICIFSVIKTFYIPILV